MSTPKVPTYIDEIHRARLKAKKDLEKLDEEAISLFEDLHDESKDTILYQSWIRGILNLKDTNGSDDGFQPDLKCQYFDRNGFLVLRSFASLEEEVFPMKGYMKHLVEEYWHPNDDEKKDKSPAIFRTDEDQIKAQGSSDYFLDSASNVHFFAENDAVLPNGKLKEEFCIDKMSALNKSGHALHLPTNSKSADLKSNEFHKYTTSAKVYDLVTSLGWKNPVVPQSMYIFKQPRIGGTVTSHQDSTFLYTTPKQSCLGLWLALDDATLTNGCLWVRAKSHFESLRRKFKRNVDYFEMGDHSQPQMIFENLTPKADNNDDSNDQTTLEISWEGSLPGGTTENEHTISNLLSAGFIPVECKAGDLLVFNGALDHLSMANTSDKQRHTFQLHLVEGKEVGVEWAKSNWLQYPDGVDFLALGKQ